MASPAAAAPRFSQGFAAFVERESGKLVKDKANAPYPCYQKHFVRTKAAITEAFKDLDNTSALILGVGAAQDIDLMGLAKTFPRVRLVDIDLSQTRKAIAEQVPDDDLRGKFELEEADLTGIFPELSAEAERLAALEDLPYDEFVGRILDLLPTLKPAAYPYKQTKSSFVCSALVSTQLVGTLIGYLNGLTEKKYGKAFEPPAARKEAFDRFLTHVIEAHIQELNRLVSPSGRVYYADHFTVKGLVHINHPENPEIENVVEELGESGFSFTATLPDVVGKVFDVVSRQKWGWGLPVNKSMGMAQMTDDDGSVQNIPIKVTEFREYQVSSYVLKPRPVTI